MRSRLQNLGIYLAVVALAAALFASSAFAGGKKETFTGEVSDSMCGAKHMMAGDAAGCARACIDKGSKYALVVGDKVYTLESTDKATLEQLNKLAGQKAKVTGEAKGDTIAVSSVAAGQ